VKKIVAMAANLSPNQDAISPEVIAQVQTMNAAAPATPTAQDTPERRRELKVTGIMLVEPNIRMKALESITAPTLILASDHDVIRDEHTVDIFHHIPNSQLGIFPNATHMIPFDDPATFNASRRTIPAHALREEEPHRRHDEVTGKECAEADASTL
jgi:pimeloyl-ACP methyl ester carboxylesterase